MKDKIFALNNEKVERERVREMEVKTQIQPKLTSIDTAEANRKDIQEIEGQANFCFEWKSHVRWKLTK